MGVVAPVAAVVTAILPVMASILVEGAPATLQLVGFGLALVAVWFISARNGKPVEIRRRELGLAVLAGIYPVYINPGCHRISGFSFSIEKLHRLSFFPGIISNKICKMFIVRLVARISLLVSHEQIW